MEEEIVGLATRGLTCVRYRPAAPEPLSITTIVGGAGHGLDGFDTSASLSGAGRLRNVSSPSEPSLGFRWA